jgi:predicted metal-dependent enzyme (double-stranded beta helix superfamily)
VQSFAPPGDIHRVRNVSSPTAISVHVYGADLRTAGGSVRRTYDDPDAAR